VSAVWVPVLKVPSAEPSTSRAQLEHAQAERRNACARYLGQLRFLAGQRVVLFDHDLGRDVGLGVGDDDCELLRSGVQGVVHARVVEIDRPVLAADVTAVAARLVAQVEAFAGAAALQFFGVAGALQHAFMPGFVANVGVQAVAAAGPRNARAALEGVGVAHLAARAAVVEQLEDGAAQGAHAALQLRPRAAPLLELTLGWRRLGAFEIAVGAVVAASAERRGDADGERDSLGPKTRRQLSAA